jgi:hypothetical protein
MASRTDGIQHKRLLVTRATVLAVVGVFVFAAVAFADNLLVDGDGTAPVTANFLNMGQICSSGGKTKPAAVGIQASNHPGGVDVFAPGSTVTFTVTSSAPSLSGTSGSLVIPTDWVTAPNGTMAPVATVSVTMRGGPIGAQASDWMAYTAVGRNVAGQPLSRTTWLNVRAAFVFCADTIAPVLSLPGDVQVEAAGPAGAVVLFTATAFDVNPINPTVSCTPASGSTFPVGTTTVQCSATDAAGNTSIGSFTVTVRDGVSPTVSVALSPATPTGDRGWYSAPVTVTVTAADSVGLASVRYTLDGTSAAYDGPFQVGDGMHTIAATATDRSGNSATADPVTFKVDTTAPTVTLGGGSALRAASLSRESLTCQTIDALSGVATDAVLVITGGNSNGTGTFTATCTGATDNAGNAAAPVSVTFVVGYETGTGILPPIAPGSDRLLVRGQTVPVKFGLPGDEGLRSGFNTAGWKVEALQIDCRNPGSALSTVELTSTNARGFKYTGDRYHFNADLRGLERGTCWQIRVTLDDGTELLSGTFQLTGKSKQAEESREKGKSSSDGNARGSTGARR